MTSDRLALTEFVCFGVPAGAKEAGFARFAGPVSAAVATPRRRERYALTRDPDAFEAGLRGERFPGFYFKREVTAYHHLLRVLSGLDAGNDDAPEAIAQAQAALAHLSGERAEALSSVLRSALRAQRLIRAQPGPGAARELAIQRALVWHAERTASTFLSSFHLGIVPREIPRFVTSPSARRRRPAPRR